MLQNKKKKKKKTILRKAKITGMTTLSSILIAFTEL